MKCYYHQDREAVGMCVSCGKPICAECKVVLEDKFYCNKCAEKLLVKTTSTGKTKGLNWFERHLNWTVVLSWFVIYPALGIFVLEPYLEEQTFSVIGWLTLIIFGLLLPLFVSGWALKKKSRSLWNFLWFLVPFGSIVFLFLENRSQIDGLNCGQEVSLLIKETSKVVKDAIQTIKNQLDAAEHSKLPKVEDELFYFFVFALDYWIQKSTNSSLDEKRIFRKAFQTHLATIINKDTVQQRFNTYGQIVNDSQDGDTEFTGLGMKLSEFCGMPDEVFLVLAPDLFTKAFESVSKIESELPQS